MTARQTYAALALIVLTSGVLIYSYWDTITEYDLELQLISSLFPVALIIVGLWTNEKSYTMLQ